MCKEISLLLYSFSFDVRHINSFYSSIMLRINVIMDDSFAALNPYACRTYLNLADAPNLFS